MAKSVPESIKKMMHDPKMRGLRTMNMQQLDKVLKDGGGAEQLAPQGPSAAQRNKGPFLDLWVRAGSDGLKNGADPVCHEVFLELLIKSSDPNCTMQFNVKTVNLAKPHPEFVNEDLKHVPALVFGEETFEHIDEIQEFIDSRFPRPSLQYFDPDADTACADLFSRFARLLKGAGDADSLSAVLSKINAHLEENDDQKWLCGNQLTHLDCHILPTLHHIRIAAHYVKGFQIPDSLSHLKRYMQDGYKSSHFRKSCPSDQEIILYWAEKPETPNLDSHVITELANQEPAFSLEFS